HSCSALPCRAIASCITPSAIRFAIFVSAFFLPVFFTYTGLRTDVGMLGGGGQWLLCGLICLVAIAGKWGSCTLAARYTGVGWGEANCIGVLMNTRGLMELIVINVGYDLGIIDRTLFTILVLMAIVTNLMTTPLLLWLRKGTELEEKIALSPYFKK